MSNVVVNTHVILNTYISTVLSDISINIMREVVMHHEVVYHICVYIA